MSEIDISLKVSVDDSQLEKDLKKIERRSDLQIIPKVDTDIFASELDKLKVNPILIPIKLDTSTVDKQLKQIAKEFSDKNLLLDINVSSKQFDSLFKKVQKQLSKVQLKPKVDHSGLQELNEHLDLKKTHYDDINSHFASNPLKVNYDRNSINNVSKELQSLKKEFKTVKNDSDSTIVLKAESDNNSIEQTKKDINKSTQELKEFKQLAKEDVEVKVIVDTEVLSKIKEEITTADEKFFNTVKTVKDTATQPFEKEIPTDDRYIQSQINDIYTSTQGLELDSSIGDEISGAINSNTFITNNFLKSIFTEAVLIRKEAKAIANKSDKTLAITTKVSALDMGDIALSVARLDFGKINNQQGDEIESGENKELDELDRNLERLRVTFNQQISKIEQELRNQITPLVIEIERVSREVFKLSIPLKKSNQLLRTGNISTKQAILLVKSALDVGFNVVQSLLKSIDSNISGYNIDAIFSSLLSNIRSELTRGFATSFAKSFYGNLKIDPKLAGKQFGERSANVAGFGIDFTKEIANDVTAYGKRVFDRLELPDLTKAIGDSIRGAFLDSIEIENEALDTKEFLSKISSNLRESYKGETDLGGKLNKTFSQLFKLSNYSPYGGDKLEKIIKDGYQKELEIIKENRDVLLERNQNPEVQEQIKQEYEKQKNLLQAEARQQYAGIAASVNPTVNNAVTRTVIPRIAPIIEKVIRDKRKEGLEKGLNLALARAEQILTKSTNLKKQGLTNQEGLEGNDLERSVRQDSPLVIREETKELFITIGGYAGHRTKASGMRIATDIAQATEPETSAIGVKNPDTDYAESKNKLLSAQLRTLLRPNLRGFSKDAVEMAAQAIAALTIKPEIKIKFLGESGGGFPAEEATKILEMLGYGEQVEGAGFGTPKLIGDLQSKKYKGYLGKGYKENIGYMTQEFLAPLGLADISAPEQNLENLEGHSWAFYKPTKEYESYVSANYKPAAEDFENIENYIESLRDTFFSTRLESPLGKEELKGLKEELISVSEFAGFIKNQSKGDKEQSKKIKEYEKELNLFKELFEEDQSNEFLIYAKQFVQKVNESIDQALESSDKNTVNKKLQGLVKEISLFQVGLTKTTQQTKSQLLLEEYAGIDRELKNLRASIGSPNAPDTRIYEVRSNIQSLKEYNLKNLSEPGYKVDEKEFNFVNEAIEIQNQNLRRIIDGFGDKNESLALELPKLANKLKELQTNLAIARGRQQQDDSRIESVKNAIKILFEEKEFRNEDDFNEQYKRLRSNLISASKQKKENKSNVENLEKQVSQVQSERTSISKAIEKNNNIYIKEIEAYFDILREIQDKLRSLYQKYQNQSKKPPSSDGEEDEPPTPVKPTKPTPKPPSSDGGEDEQPPPTKPTKPTPKTPSSGGGSLADELTQAVNANINPIIDSINQALDRIAIEAGSEIGKSTVQALEARFILLLQKNIQQAFKQSLLDVVPKLQTFSAESIKENISQSLQPSKKLAEVEPDKSIPETIKTLEELKEIAGVFRGVAKLAKESVRIKDKEAYAISAANTADEFIQEIDKYIQSLPKEERTKTREGILSANVKSQITRVQNDINKVLAQIKTDLSEVEGEAISELKALIKEIRQFFIAQKNILKQETDKVTPQKIDAAEKVAIAAEPANAAMEQIKQSEKLRAKISSEVKATKSQITQAAKIVDVNYKDIKKEADRVAKEYEKVGESAVDGLEIGAKIKEVKELGERIGEALESGTKDSLDTQSPSKKYIKIGEDIVKGLEIGSKGIINVIRTIDRQITSLTPRVSEAIEQARRAKEGLEQGISQTSQQIGQDIQSATQTVQQNATEIGENIQNDDRMARVRQAGQETLEEFQNLNNTFSSFVRQVQQDLGGIQASEAILNDVIDDSIQPEDSEQKIQNIFNQIGGAIRTGFQLGANTLRPVLERVDRDILEFGLRLYNAIATIFDIKGIIEPIFSQLSQIIQNQLLDINKNFEDALALKNVKNLIKGFSKDAETEFKRLVKAANTYGQDLRKIAETSISFELSFQGTALEGNTQQITENLFQGLSAFNPSAEKFDQAITALNQIASKGVVSMEEIRQQLSEALPGALSIAARSMNLTQQEFNNLVSSGNLLSEEFLPKFAAQLKAETFTAFVTNSQSAASSLGTLRNEIFLTSAAMGDAYVNLGKPFFDLITNALRAIKENLNIIGSIFNAALAWNILQLGRFIGRILIATGVLSGGITGAYNI